MNRYTYSHPYLFSYFLQQIENRLLNRLHHTYLLGISHFFVFMQVMSNT
ncbi:unknown [Bacteroides sp. CAG:661]|nr:unknown [Bacteroides sp. CAG:661]